MLIHNNRFSSFSPHCMKQIAKIVSFSLQIMLIDGFKMLSALVNDTEYTCLLKLIQNINILKGMLDHN